MGLYHPQNIHSGFTFNNGTILAYYLIIKIIFMNMSKVSYSGLAGSLSLLAIFLVMPTVSHAAIPTNCEFTRTIEDGMDGEDVRCLQKYLNASGFKIAETGPGAPGQETSLYRTLTKEAVIKWQKAKGLSPAIGMFAEQSKAAYLKDVLAQVQDLKTTQSVVSVTTPVTPQPVVAGVTTIGKIESQKDAEKSITSAMKMILDAYEELPSLRSDNPKKADKVEEDVRDSLENLFASLALYFEGNYTKANSGAANALDDATNSFEDAGGESYKSKAEKILDDVEDLYDDVDEMLSKAEDRDVDVGDAPDLFEEAGSLLDDAWDSFDEGVYKQSISDALDAEELLQDAKSEINIVSDKDAEAYVEKVWDQLDDAENEISDAENDDEDVDDAWDLFDDAERNLKKADLAIDDEDYSEANDLAKDAKDLIEEALDSIGGSGGDEADAEEALDDAWKEYKNIKSDVSDAEDDGDDMDDAWDYLDEAKDLLKDADTAFDDEDYDEVMDLVDEAMDLIADAEDEL